MSLAAKICDAIEDKERIELALGYLRYEALRKLGPGQFNGLHHDAMRTGKTIDTLVDESIEKDAK